MVDPFAGGGAIPLEGLRCGAEVFASDLNPVAVLLNKVALEFVPKYGSALADEFAKWGDRICSSASKSLATYYPTSPGECPVAYIWARTVKCDGPGCGVDIPLLRSLLLDSKGKAKTGVQFHAGNSKLRTRLVVQRGKVWHYLDDDSVCADPEFAGTVARGAATCPRCGYTTAVTRVREQLSARAGGANDAKLMGVVISERGAGGRRVREPQEADSAAFRDASVALEAMQAEHTGTLSLVPDEEVDTYHHDVNRLPMYGMATWADAFNKRQLLTLATLGREVRGLPDDGANGMMSVVRLLLALAVDRQADYTSSLCTWANGFVRSSFGRQALAMVWDYAEVNPFSGETGAFSGALKWIEKVLRRESGVPTGGQAIQCDATAHPLPDDSAQLLFTDPPYYDAIDYAVIADFYYVWLRRNLGSWSDVDLSPPESPKDREIVVDSTTTKGQGKRDHEFYQKMMGEALEQGRRYVAPDGLGVLVFAHKSTSGWEAQLAALLAGGWTVTGSWPIDTERPGRMRAIDSAALASSVHLICRPRENQDGTVTEDVGDWRDVLAELPDRIADWLPRLASEGVVGADAIFACLGPALEIYSRYSSVEKTSGEKVELREYLEQVWAEVARQALNMIFEGADTAGLEEDARLTAMWLWTLRTDANVDEPADGEGERIVGYALEFDAARKIAQGLGCHLENLTHLVEIGGETATLLSAATRARYLFGKEDVDMPKKRVKKTAQADLFAELNLPSDADLAREQAEFERPAAGSTVLDQLHQSMVLFGAGRGAALKRFLVDDGVGSSPQLWSLAQSLSALYPPQSEEKRWVDGVLARKKGLGF